MIAKNSLQLLLFLILLTGLSNISYAQKINAFIDDYLDQTLSNNVGGYSYVIFKENSIIAQGGNGVAVPDPLQPKMMTPETRMQIASCSKTITAIALLKELENNAMNIEATLGEILNHEFPKMSELTKTITLKNLLTHTSGYNFGYLDTPHKMGLEKLFSENPPNSIGAAMSYSNLNYAILRYLIECLSKTDYEVYVKNNVFDKIPNNLSMSPSGGDAHGYNFPDLESSPIDIDFSDTNEYYAAAYGWYSSALELAKMGNQLMYNNILSDSLTRQMFDQELGLFKSNSAQFGNVYSHEGQWIISGKKGIRTLLLLIPSQKIVGVLFVNTNAPIKMGRTMLNVLEYCSPYSWQDYNQYPPSKATKMYLYIESPILCDKIKYDVFDEKNNLTKSDILKGPIILEKGTRVEYQGFIKDQPVTFKMENSF